jgi:hypothetical protein
MTTCLKTITEKRKALTEHRKTAPRLAETLFVSLYSAIIIAAAASIVQSLFFKLQPKKKKTTSRRSADDEYIAVNVETTDNDSHESFAGHLKATSLFESTITYFVGSVQIQRQSLLCLSPLQPAQLSFSGLDPFVFAPVEILFMHIGIDPLYESLFTLIRTQAYFYSQVKAISLLVSESYGKPNGDPGITE